MLHRFWVPSWKGIGSHSLPNPANILLGMRISSPLQFSFRKRGVEISCLFLDLYFQKLCIIFPHFAIASNKKKYPNYWSQMLLISRVFQAPPLGKLNGMSQVIFSKWRGMWHNKRRKRSGYLFSPWDPVSDAVLTCIFSNCSHSRLLFMNVSFQAVVTAPSILAGLLTLYSPNVIVGNSFL